MIGAAQPFAGVTQGTARIGFATDRQHPVARIYRGQRFGASLPTFTASSGATLSVPGGIGLASLTRVGIVVSSTGA